MNPEVTVVVVTEFDCTKPLADRLEEPFSQEALATIESVEKQPGPKNMFIVCNVEGRDPLEIERWGVQRAETEWVAVIHEGATWPDNFLDRVKVKREDYLR